MKIQIAKKLFLMNLSIMKHILDLGEFKLGGKKSDRVIMSSPYLPRSKEIEKTPHEGVGLSNDVIANGGEFLTEDGILIVTTSSLSQDIVEQAIDEAKSKYSVSCKSIGGKRVPLKVMSVLNNEKWMSYLLKRGLKKTLERGYEYWHDIEILELKYG